MHHRVSPRLTVSPPTQGDFESSVKHYKQACELDTANAQYKSDYEGALAKLNTTADGGMPAGMPPMSGGMPDMAAMMSNPAVMQVRGSLAVRCSGPRPHSRGRAVSERGVLSPRRWRRI
eukprot:SAG11_NODE_4180_length_2025_cov_44.048806_3_plen_119_part_00